MIVSLASKPGRRTHCGTQGEFLTAVLTGEAQ
jgi:hypothetical protein